MSGVQVVEGMVLKQIKAAFMGFLEFSQKPAITQMNLTPQITAHWCPVLSCDLFLPQGSVVGRTAGREVLNQRYPDT